MVHYPVCERMEEGVGTNCLSMILPADKFQEFQRSSQGVFLHSPSQHPVVRINATHVRRYQDTLRQLPSIFVEATSAWTQYCDEQKIKVTGSLFLISKIDAPYKFQRNDVVTKEKVYIPIAQTAKLFDLLGFSKQYPDIFDNIAQHLPGATVSNLSKTCTTFALNIGSRLWSFPLLKAAKFFDDNDASCAYDLQLSLWYDNKSKNFAKSGKKDVMLFRNLMLEQSIAVDATAKTHLTPLNGVWLLGGSKLMNNSASELVFKPNVCKDQDNTALQFKLVAEQFFCALESSKVVTFLEANGIRVSLITNEVLENIRTNVRFQVWRKKRVGLATELMTNKHPRLSMISSDFTEANKHVAKHIEMGEWNWFQNFDWNTLRMINGFRKTNGTSFSLNVFFETALNLQKQQQPISNADDENLNKLSWDAAIAIQDVNSNNWILSQHESARILTAKVSENAIKSFEIMLCSDILTSVNLEATKSDQCKKSSFVLQPEWASKCIWIPERPIVQKVTMNLFIRNYRNNMLSFYLTGEVDVTKSPNVHADIGSNLKDFTRVGMRGKYGDVLWLSDGKRCFCVNVDSEEIDDMCQNLESRHVAMQENSVPTQRLSERYIDRNRHQSSCANCY